MNEYLREFSAISNDWYSRWEKRELLTRKYAWAIPTDKAISTLAALGSLIEIGAGTGYWAKLISDAGGDIIAYDYRPPSKKNNPYKHTTQYFNVSYGKPKTLKRYRTRILFLCWPPYATRMAADCLLNYKGDIFAYVGEGAYGCNGDDLFWTLVERYWEEDKTMRLPQWAGIHDNLVIFRKRVRPLKNKRRGD